MLSPVIMLGYILASIDTKSNGIFCQKRIGQYAKTFVIFKLKTINPETREISKLGIFLRKFKIDELPQLINILIGDMSFVGPRPDIPGYYDTLQGEDKKILNLKPGITSMASLKYFDEEFMLAKQNNPEKYNNEVIFPDKVKMNLEYYNSRNFYKDLNILFHTIQRMFRR